jgi:hypothetical protein
MAYDLGDYKEVPDRIAEFKQEYPQGSLQGSYHLQEIAGDTWVVYIASAYRTADDERPGIGMAWEPFPGKTNYTKDSELMNAETSAWGRAIVALGFMAKGEKVASANEVRSRQSNGSGPRDSIPPSDKQLDLIERKLKDAGADTSDIPNMRGYCAENLTGGKEGSASKLIDKLMGQAAGQTALDLSKATQDWLGTQSDVPADTEGLPV